MNFNANQGTRHPGPVRKPKRVSDVNAIGQTAPMPAPYMQPAFQEPLQPQQPPQQFNGNPNYGYPGGFPAQQNDFNSYGGFQPQQPPVQQPQQQQAPGPNIPPQFAMFQQPMVQDMAMQYGQKLADQGKELVNKEFEKYIPVTRLKYYFSVDNKYVINKLRLLFFPFTHRDWSLKYNEDSPVQPRYDVNAPDLYIPVMAYITYVLIAGLVLGMQNRFTPEQLGIQASSALAWSIFELAVYSICLYVANIPTTLKTLDLLSFSGYKYVIIVASILVSMLFQKTGFYITLIYSGCTLAYFLIRTLKAKIMSEPTKSADPPSYDPYGAPQQQHFDYAVGRKRKLYFMFLVAGLQPVFSFWLTMHLIPSSAEVFGAPL